MKIFILSPNYDTLFSPDLQDQLAQAGDLVIQKDVVPFDQVPGLMQGGEDRILAMDPDYSDWTLPNEVIDRIPHLKAVVLQTTSFSWVDGTHLSDLGIPLINLRGFSSIAVAEWATMMVINLARKIPIVVQDDWKLDYTRHQGIELRGKTAGVIGLGSIGTAIAENMAGLGMQVQYYSKSSQDSRFASVSLAELMSTSDVILPAVAQNQDTRGMITDDMLHSMKKTAIFVTIVHHVYNHDLLLDLAQSGQIYGYGFEDKKAEFDKQTGNIWAGPELAWCTADSMTKNAIQWAKAIINASQASYPTKVN
jgi:phosphoglycerate dehydrogenase-like enzyme